VKTQKPINTFNYYFRLAKEQGIKLMYLKNLEMWIVGREAITNNRGNILVVKDFSK